ncbi:MAG: PilZ domain-containing protein [Desulfobacterales bacterium]|nr:PilZ domain-containing protein [Desulfobacterales bacterium]
MTPDLNKVFVSSDNMATFVCPQCENTARVDVSKYNVIDKGVRIKCKCRCGHVYRVSLEKRKLYRKPTNLVGSYTQIMDGEEVDRGTMSVKDVSRTGLKLKLNVARNFKIGDKLVVEFHLDDKARSHIRKMVIIRNLDGPFVGVQFDAIDAHDRALGFYLFS